MHQPWLDALLAAGIGLLSWDRPGYGGSTALPGRRVADVVADAVAVAEAAGLARFAVWGVGGGGPHALACAAMLADRVLAAAVVEPVAPFDAAGLDWFAGMAAADPEQAVELFGAGLPAKDRAVLSEPQIPAFLLACIREGLTAGPEGWVEDDLALMAPWGVDVASARVPVALWHGQQNWPTPLSHARWLADAIPGAELRLLAGEGALSVIFGHVSDVIDWLGVHLHGDS